MPEKKTIQRAQRAKRQGKPPTTQAGEFVREEMDHIKAGKHGARSRKQAIAIGLSKARRSGVRLPAPGRGQTSKKTRKSAARDYRKGGTTARGKRGKRTIRQSPKRTSPKRSRASLRALEREPKVV